MMLNDVQAVLVHQLKDLLHAEKQLVRALPKMARAAHDPELRSAFEEHLVQTEEHVHRLEKVFAKLGVAPRGHRCHGMEGLIAEGAELFEMNGEPAAMDAALIAAAQRVEHYEIAGYGCARSFAERLGDDTVVELLQATLDEEGETDKRLTRLTEGLMIPQPERAHASR